MFVWQKKYVVNSNQMVFRVWNGCTAGVSNLFSPESFLTFILNTYFNPNNSNNLVLPEHLKNVGVHNSHSALKCHKNI